MISFDGNYNTNNVSISVSDVNHTKTIDGFLVEKLIKLIVILIIIYTSS